MNVSSNILGNSSLATLGANLGSAANISASANLAGALNAFADEVQEPITPDPATARAMSDFESVFVSALIKQMRQSIDGDGLFPGDKSDSLGGLFDMFMGQHLAQSGGLGVSEMLLDTYRQSAS